MDAGATLGVVRGLVRGSVVPGGGLVRGLVVPGGGLVAGLVRLEGAGATLGVVL